MKSASLLLGLPLSLAGAVALVLKVYALTSAAQLASAELVRAFAQLSQEFPKIFFAFGMLIVLGALSAIAIRFVWALSYRVELTGKVRAMQTVRLAGRDSVISRKLLDSGYHVVDNTVVQFTNNSKVLEDK